MNRSFAHLALGLLCFLGLTSACGGGDSEPHNAMSACDRPESMICVQYDKLTPSLKTSLETACLDENALVIASCSPYGAVGTCQLALDSGGATSLGYYYGGDAATLEAACVASKGTWTPG